MTRPNDSTKPRVAIVEDDCDLRASVVDYLTAKGYGAWGVDCAEALYRRLVVDAVDVIVLDIGLPGEDGLTIARHLSRSDNIAIVILSGRNGIDDRIDGLDCGADRYLVKPLDLRELGANIDAVWRRLARKAEATNPEDIPAAMAAWRLDGERWLLASPSGTFIPLTSKEYLFLRCLFAAAGGVASKAEIAAQLGHNGATADYHRIDVLVGRLRKKGATLTGQALPIRTVTALGYTFAAQYAPA